MARFVAMIVQFRKSDFISDGENMLGIQICRIIAACLLFNLVDIRLVEDEEVIGS